MTQHYVGRLAPSPTGLLHLGNAFAFLWTYVFAQGHGGKVFLRMEDIDPERSRSHYAQSIEEDLRWLGIHWDDAVICQSQRSQAYEQAIHYLQSQGYIYPCYCTRKELRSLAGAPHMDDAGAPYPGTCQHLSLAERMHKEALGRKACLRLRCDSQKRPIIFDDAIMGTQQMTLQALGGDFALRRSDSVVAYQLAVVVDDAYQGITHIVRGCDIMVSTPRQLYLSNLLGYAQACYAHVPLLFDTQGERLAKRHASLSLQSLRTRGIRASKIIGLLAYLSGIIENIQEISIDEICHTFPYEYCIEKLADRKNGIFLQHEHMKALMA